MKVKADLTKVLKEAHQEKWIALSGDHGRVLDYDADLLALAERMKANQERYVLKKVLRFDTEYCFSFSWRLE